MASEFALSFTLDGMALARRTRTGEWRTLGTVAADSPVRGLEMRALAQRVRRHSGGDARVALLVPDTEVLCFDLPEVPGGRAAEAATVRAALDGRTPYSIEELCFDWVVAQGRLQVAAVACELLDELTGLSRGAGFDVQEISAVLPLGSYAAEPVFVPRATIASADAETPAATPVETPVETPVAETAPEPDPETAPEPAAAPVPEPAADARPEPAAAIASEAAPAAPEPAASTQPEVVADGAPETAEAVAAADEQPETKQSAPSVEAALPTPPGASADAEAGDLEPRAHRRAVGRRRVEAEPGAGPTENKPAEVPAPVSFSSKRDGAARLGRRPGPVLFGRAPSVSGAPTPLGTLPAATGPDTGRPRFSTAASAGSGGAAAALRAEAPPDVVQVGEARRVEAAPEPRPSSAPVNAFEARPPVVTPLASPAAPSVRSSAGDEGLALFGRYGRGEFAEEARETRRMRRVAGAGILAVLLAGGAFWWFGGGSPEPGEGPRPDRAAAVAPDAAGPAQTGAIAPPADLRIGTQDPAPTPAPAAAPEPVPEAVAAVPPVTAPAVTAATADAPPPAPLADAPRAALPELSADSLSLEALALPPEPRRPLVVSGARLPDYGSGPGDIAPLVPGALAPVAESAAPPASSASATATQPTVNTVAEAVAAAVAEAAALAPPPGAAESAADVDLRAGQPVVVPPPRPAPEPATLQPLPATQVQTPAADTPRPRARPGAAVPEVAETVAATAAPQPDQPAAALAPRPRARPAALEPAPVPAAPPPQEETRAAPPVSPVPRSRPARISLASAPASAPVASILRPAAPSAEAPRSAAPTPAPEASTPAAAAAVAPAGPVLPTRTSVARAATEEGQIALRKINLVGVYGAPGDRRALVRLGNGRYVKIEVGDELDGGRVAAIGERDITYVKRGEALRLAMPGDG